MPNITEHFEAQVVKGLLKRLRPNFTGKLDKQSFQKVSTDSSGKRFVIKGFVDGKSGPAVRLSSNWGDLSGGFAWYMKNAQSDWEDVDEKIIGKFDGLKMVIRIDFTASDGRHSAIFTAVGKL